MTDTIDLADLRALGDAELRARLASLMSIHPSRVTEDHLAMTDAIVFVLGERELGL